MLFISHPLLQLIHCCIQFPFNDIVCILYSTICLLGGGSVRGYPARSIVPFQVIRLGSFGADVGPERRVQAQGLRPNAMCTTRFTWLTWLPWNLTLMRAVRFRARGLGLSILHESPKHRQQTIQVSRHDAPPRRRAYASCVHE